MRQENIVSVREIDAPVEKLINSDNIHDCIPFPLDIITVINVVFQSETLQYKNPTKNMNPTQALL